MQEYLPRVSRIVSHIKTYGKPLSNEIVVSKMLRSLTTYFNQVVAVLEELKDVSMYSFDELMGSLLTYEVRINRSCERAEEKAFQMKGESNKVKLENSAARNQGRGGCHDHGHGRGRG